LHVVIQRVATRIEKVEPNDAKSVSLHAKLHAVLDFALARALDAAVGDTDLVGAILRGEPGKSLDAYRIALDPSQQLLVKETIERICPIFRVAAGHGNAALAIRNEYQRRWKALRRRGPVRDWLRRQVDVWTDVANTCTAAFQLADELPKEATLRPDMRGQAVYESLISRPRREQTRILNGDALRLHEEFKLSAAEIGEIWKWKPSSER
jgi:hypothetical protein